MSMAYIGYFDCLKLFFLFRYFSSESTLRFLNYCYINYFVFEFVSRMDVKSIRRIAMLCCVLL